MIFDHRVYTAYPNQLHNFLGLYEAQGLPLQRKYLGEPFGFFYTEIGRLNRLVSLWRYDSVGDRQARRDEMEADPAWQDYRREVIRTNYLADMENQILRPARFFQSK